MSSKDPQEYYEYLESKISWEDAEDDDIADSCANDPNATDDDVKMFCVDPIKKKKPKKKKDPSESFESWKKRHKKNRDFS